MSGFFNLGKWIGKKKKFTSAGLDSPVIKGVKPSVPKTDTEKGISIMRKLNQRVRATNSRLKQQIFETKQKIKKVDKIDRNKTSKEIFKNTDLKQKVDKILNKKPFKDD